MPPKYDYKQGMKIGNWTLSSRLGKGGNGEVWKARNNGSEAAIKILSKVYGERYERFRREVEFLISNPSEGILPILDSNLPDTPNRENPAWLTMPIATPIKDALGDNPTLEVVVEAVANIAETLAKLHEQGISHRDIKPDNLYQFGESWVIGDFGLVKLPEKNQITREGERLGPLYFIAPEMIEKAGRVDGTKADVYSLAKTLWVLVVNDSRFPPPGPQSAYDQATSLRMRISHQRIEELDFLIERATLNDIEDRLSMKDFAIELHSWLNPSYTSNNVNLSDLASKLPSRLAYNRLQVNKAKEAAQIAEKRTKNIFDLMFQGLQRIESLMKSAGFEGTDVIPTNSFPYDTFNQTLESLAIYTIISTHPSPTPTMIHSPAWENMACNSLIVTDFPDRFFSSVFMQLSDSSDIELSVYLIYFTYRYAYLPMRVKPFYIENRRLPINSIGIEKKAAQFLEEFITQLHPTLDKFFEGLGKMY